MGRFAVKSCIAIRVIKMGSIFDNRIDYNGVGVHSASGTHIIKN